MGTALFLLLGLVIWVGLAVGLGLLGDATGIPPAIYHDPPIGYEIDGEYLETSSTPTSFGQALMILHSCWRSGSHSQ